MLIASANGRQPSSDQIVPIFAARLGGAKLLRTYLTGTGLGTSVGVTAEGLRKAIIDLVTFLPLELGGHSARPAGIGE
ncbi:hypothetical protein [Amycolatopsis sp. H20-H5]|uniref:hypothetical protein n=1 Tax=Amycolatopsis sp. H20-H5 TaxID=3046309 RepID=UPI002DBB8F85|nr:hypothetical protein [Amycolatopsis sp. H20-H5]MEC3975802.1 hypothetical protein [Amycolatopsis sp. H20-H5]